MHPVVTERQIVRQHEAGLADPVSIQVKWSVEVVDLAYAGTDGAVLELQPHLGRLTVGHVYPERRLSAGPAQNRRRQRARPVGAFVSGLRRTTFQLVGSGDAERGQDRNQRAFGDREPATAPVVVVGGAPDLTGGFSKRG